MLTTCDLRITRCTLFPWGGGGTLPYSSFLVTCGPIDFLHPYKHNKYVIVQYSTMDNQKKLQSITKGDFNFKLILI